MSRVCRYPKLLFVFRNDFMLAHQTSYPIPATNMTVFIQLRMDSRTAMSFVTSAMNSFDFYQYEDIYSLVSTGVTPHPQDLNALSLEMDLPSSTIKRNTSTFYSFVY
jgi:hypothetical protein